MSAVIGSLRVDLSMRSAAFNRGVDEAQRRLAGLQRTFKRIGRQMQGIGRGLSVGVSAPLVAIAHKARLAAKAQEQAVASVDAALKSMGEGAGFTLSQLEKMASKLQDKSLYGDEDVLNKVTANLLTFGNVQGEVFERAQQSALDLSARLGQDLQSSTVMLGKALNDPLKGLTALSRVGVAFTKQQEEQIKAMAKAGDVAGAQALMLAELEKQYSGQAEALARLDSGRITQAWNSVGDALEHVGRIIQPVLADFADRVKAVAEGFQKLSPEVQKFIVAGGAIAAVLGPLTIAAGVIVAAFGAVAPVIVSLAVPLAALGSLAGVVVAAWGPLTDAVNYLRERLLLLSPVLLLVAARLSDKLVAACAMAARGFIGLAAATGQKLVGNLIGAASQSLALERALGATSTRAAVAGVAVKAFSGALRVMRAALISTGIGALIVGAGLLVGKLVDLYIETGSLRGAFKALWDLFGRGLDWASAKVASWSAALSAKWYGAMASVLEATNSGLNTVLGLFTGAGSAIIAAWGVVSDGVVGLIRGLPEEIYNIVVSIPDRIVAGLDAGLQKIVNKAREIGTAIKEGIAGGQGGGSSVRRNNRRGGDFHNSGIQAAEDFSDGFKEGADINSPSKVFEGHGKDIAAGLEGGVSASSLGQRMASAASDAFNSEMSKQHTTLGLDTAAKLRQTSEAFSEAARMLGAGVSASFEQVETTVERANTQVTEVQSALIEAGQAGEAMGDGVESGAARSAEALAKVAKGAKETTSSLSNVAGGFVDSVLAGDVSGGISGLFSGIQKEGVSAFGSLLKDQLFSAAGGGVSGVVSGLGAGIKTGVSALSSVFTGGGLASLGTAVSSFLPVIGVATAAVKLVKGFSSEKVIGQGIELGIENGQIAGGSYEKVESSSWWGLKKSTSTDRTGFDSSTLSGLNAQLSSIKGAVSSAYESLGVTVSASLLKSVGVSIEKIKSDELSEEEINAKIQEIFARYGDALSRAIGGVDLQSAINLSQVNSLLEPLGQAFDTLTSRSRVARAARASDALLDVAGGVDALGQKVSSFYQGFLSDGEKLQVMQSSIARTFHDLSLAVPATDTAFKELVLSQDLYTASGRAAYNALLDIAPVFAQVTDALGNVSVALGDVSTAAEWAAVSAEAVREGLLESLLPEGQQIEKARSRLAEAFEAIGFSLPDTVAGLSEILSGLDLSTEEGRNSFDQVQGLLPDFQRIADYLGVSADALNDLRGGYTLDASRYATEFEAKLANELANVGAYGDETLNLQNAEVKRQGDLLGRIVDLLAKQNRIGSDSLLLSGMV